MNQVPSIPQSESENPSVTNQPTTTDPMASSQSNDELQEEQLDEMSGGTRTSSIGTTSYNIQPVNY